MNAGSIYRNTKPGRLFEFFRGREGEWVDAWELGEVIKSTCLSTHISGVRSQLPEGDRIDHRQMGDLHYYRYVRFRPAEQMGLFNDLSMGVARGYEI